MRPTAIFGASMTFDIRHLVRMMLMVTVLQRQKETVMTPIQILDPMPLKFGMTASIKIVMATMIMMKMAMGIRQRRSAVRIVMNLIPP